MIHKPWFLNTSVLNADTKLQTLAGVPRTHYFEKVNNGNISRQFKIFRSWFVNKKARDPGDSRNGGHSQDLSWGRAYMGLGLETPGEIS